MQEIGGWQKNEKMVELDELLEHNLLDYDGRGEVPTQIESYLSSNLKELRNLETDDLGKLREGALMHKFEKKSESKEKRLKEFRFEAVQAGFKKAWRAHDYGIFISVVRKISENDLQEDPELPVWYDQAVIRSKEE